MVLRPDGMTSDLVLASDSSVDRTLEIADDIIQRSGVVVRSYAGSVGAARALAAEIALQRYTGHREQCWLANTDADCKVPRLVVASGFHCWPRYHSCRRDGGCRTRSMNTIRRSRNASSRPIAFMQMGLILIFMEQTWACEQMPTCGRADGATSTQQKTKTFGKGCGTKGSSQF